MWPRGLHLLKPSSARYMSDPQQTTCDTAMSVWQICWSCMTINQMTSELCSENGRRRPFCNSMSQFSHVYWLNVNRKFVRLCIWVRLISSSSSFLTCTMDCIAPYVDISIHRGSRVFWIPMIYMPVCICSVMGIRSPTNMLALLTFALAVNDKNK